MVLITDKKITLNLPSLKLNGLRFNVSREMITPLTKERYIAIINSPFSVTVETDKIKVTQYIKKILKIENCTISIPREIHTVAARAAPGDLGLKSHPKDYQQNLTYNYGHPSKYKPKRTWRLTVIVCQ